MMNRARQLIGLPFFITAFICIILTFAPVQVSATYDDISDNSNDIAAQSQAYIDIYNALSDSVPEINVLEHNISINDLGDLYFQVILENPELFYVVTAAEYTYNTNNIVVDIIPQYSMSGSDLATAKQTYASELYKIVAGVPEGLTDLEKVLYINSYFSVNFSYDTRQENTIYDAYGLFTQKVGVCQAYSAAFIAVMQELSIPVSYAVTVDDPPAGGDGHMWNLVKINDHWYHIDLTWNDPVSDMPGRSVYYYFLLSDIAMGEFHSEWISSYECTDTTYDNYFWRNVKAPFIYSEGSWYYINNDDFKIYRYNFATGNREVILKIKGRWPIIGSEYGVWRDCYSGLAFYKGFVVYNTYDEILVCSPETGKSYAIYRNDTNEGIICYFTLENERLTLYIYKAPGEDPVTTIVLENERLSFTRKVIYRVDDVDYAVQTYRFGEAIQPVESPQKVGYVFSGWTPDLPDVMETSDIIVQAVFVEELCDHDITYQSITHATCTTPGYHNVFCVECHTLLSVEYIPATGHNFSEWQIVPPTCTANGSKIRQCHTCNHTETESIEAIGHDYGEWEVVVIPTYTSEGLREKVCRNCGDTIFEVIPMLLDKNTQDSDTDTGSVSRDNDTTVPDANAETTQPVVHVGDHSIDMLIMLFIALASCVVVVLILLRHNRVNGD